MLGLAGGAAPPPPSSALGTEPETFNFALDQNLLNVLGVAFTDGAGDAGTGEGEGEWGGRNREVMGDVGGCIREVMGDAGGCNCRRDVTGDDGGWRAEDERGEEGNCRRVIGGEGGWGWCLAVTGDEGGCILKVTGFDFGGGGGGGVEPVEYREAVDSASSGETDGGLILVTPENAEDEDEDAGACVRGWSRRRAGEDNVPGL